MIQIKSFPSWTKNEFTEVLKKVYLLTANEFTIFDEDGEFVADINTDKKIEHKINLDLINNDLELKVSIYPGINTEVHLSFEDLADRIEEIGVTVGLDAKRLEEVYKLYINNTIISNVTVAKGIPPINGKDAEIIQKAKIPENENLIDEQGRIDYRKVKTFINVKKGDLLLIKKPATKGVAGVTVTNITIYPIEGKDIEVIPLEGVVTDNFGLKYYADVDGHFVYKGSSVAVYPVFTVKEVNYATGNIEFNGSVHIKGDVLSGFEVNAKKDIFIEGICEDAKLKAGGDINIKRGIKAKDNNLIIADGDLCVNYIENAHIRVLGDIQIRQYAFNSRLRAGGKIIATEGKGIVAGGDIIAYSLIEINKFGAEGSQKFNMAIGYKWDHIDQIKKINEEIDKMEDTINKVHNTLHKLDLKNPEVVKNPKVVQMLKLSKELDAKNTKLIDRLVELERVYKYENPKIRVLKSVEAGNSVQFYKHKINIKSSMKDTLFFYDHKNERIGWISLSELESGSELLND